MKKPVRITKSKYKDEIIDCLKSGWSPRMVVEYLRWRYGDDPEIPSLRTIERYRKRVLTEGAVLPPSIIREKLKGIDYKVNLIAHLSRLVPLLEDRVARGLEVERNMGGLLASATDKAIETYLKVLQEYRYVAQCLGVFPSKEGEGLVVAQQAVVNLPPEYAERLIKAIEMKIPPELEGGKDEG